MNEIAAPIGIVFFFVALFIADAILSRGGRR